MEVKITIQSKELSKEELQLLIQSIRNCEQKSFPDKEIFIWVEVPELSKAECAEILASIKPPYKYGPSTLFYKTIKTNKMPDIAGFVEAMKDIGAKVTAKDGTIVIDLSHSGDRVHA